jgi:predicted RNA-binding protein associated with RNAse of E/G family
MEMFSSFFSALQTFVSELTASSTETLNKIELGEYFVLISRMMEIASDLVIIIDSEDMKEAQKMIPKIVKLINSHGDLFNNWDQEPEKFQSFDLDIIKLISSNKKLVSDSSLTVNQSSILKSIWEQKGALSEQLRENLLQERQALKAEYLVENNYIKKYDCCKKLIEISEILRDDEKFIKFQTEAKSLKDEIKDRRLRLQYYLDVLKESLRLSKYAETYSYLYSLCLKLENFSEPEIIDKYKVIAKTVLNRDKVSKAEFREAIREISMIEDEINENLAYKL